MLLDLHPEWNGRIPYEEIPFTKWFEDNERFIKEHMERGYTFIDLEHAGNPAGPPDGSAFYDMELHNLYD